MDGWLAASCQLFFVGGLVPLFLPWGVFGCLSVSIALILVGRLVFLCVIGCLWMDGCQPEEGSVRVGNTCLTLPHSGGECSGWKYTCNPTFAGEWGSVHDVNTCVTLPCRQGEECL